MCIFNAQASSLDNFLEKISYCIYLLISKYYVCSKSKNRKKVDDFCKMKIFKSTSLNFFLHFKMVKKSSELREFFLLLYVYIELQLTGQQKKF